MYANGVDLCAPCVSLLCITRHSSHDAAPQEVVVLENKVAQDSTMAILSDHSIPSVVSKDLLDVLPESLRSPSRPEAAVAAVAANA